MTEWMAVRIDRALKEEIDAVRGDVPLARWVARAVRLRLPGAQPKAARDVPVPAGGDRPAQVFCPDCLWASPDRSAKCPTHDKRKLVRS